MRPAPSWTQGIIPLTVGTMALLVTGVNPVLLGSLADQGRLSTAGIGQAAMLELLAMGVAAGWAGAQLKAKHLKAIGVTAALVLVAADLLTVRATGAGVLGARAVAGLAEGVMVWISIGFIVRQGLPERWAGIYFMAQTLTQLVLVALLNQWLTPAFGANGGFAALAVAAALAGVLSAVGPDAYEALASGEGLAHLPPPRGWIALAAILVFTGGGTGVWIYLQPLAHRAGLAEAVAGWAVAASLTGQVAGSTAATLVAGRLRYGWVFLAAGVAFIGAWACLAGHPSVWLFVGAVGVTGFTGMFVSPYFVPLTIEADPTRRAAELSGGAQLLGSALGPLLVSLVVSDAEPRGALVIGAATVVVSVAVVLGLGRRRAA